jgi:Acetyltransferase (GNAT) domain
MPGAPERRPGLFIVDLGGAMIGQIILSRATGHGPPAAAGEAELGYLFLPQAWGCGYAAEACAAALGWFADELPGEPVVLWPGPKFAGCRRQFRERHARKRPGPMETLSRASGSYEK